MCVRAFVVAVVVVLFVKKNCLMLSCFINSIFNSFVISHWVYFVVIERKKKRLIKWPGLLLKIKAFGLWLLRTVQLTGDTY